MAVSNTDPLRYLTRTADGGDLVIRLSESVIVRMNIEIMKGYGATRRRGAEIGGLLLGNVNRTGSSPPVLSIDDYETIPCEYAFGPSWQLSSDEEKKLVEAAGKWRKEPGKDRYAIGLFRSHTRPGLAPDEYDNILLQRHLEGRQSVFLLVKPYGTRAGIANFFSSRNGKLRNRSDSPDFAFTAPPAGEPDSGAVPTADRQATAEPVPRPEPEHASVPSRRVVSIEESVRSAPAAKDPPAPETSAPVTTSVNTGDVRPSPPPAPRPVTDADRLLAGVLGPRDIPPAEANREWNGPQFSLYSEEAQFRFRPVLLQVGFAVAAFMFGALAGYQYAGGWLADLAPGQTLPVRDPYSMRLTASRRGDAVAVEWNRYSQPVRHARGGALIATEASQSKSIPLSQSELRTGLLLYRTSAKQVEFRLEVTVRESGLVAETATWRTGD